MKIELREISIRDVVNGYLNTDEEGVVGYSGNLNIRPKYQREFIYKDAQRERNMVIFSKCSKLGESRFSKIS